MHFSILSDSSLQIIGCEYDLGITEKNEILHTLDLLGHDLVKGDNVLVKMMNLLQAIFINGWIFMGKKTYVKDPSFWPTHHPQNISQKVHDFGS
jgi:hypothetical protein